LVCGADYETRQAEKQWDNYLKQSERQRLESEQQEDARQEYEAHETNVGVLVMGLVTFSLVGYLFLRPWVKPLLTKRQD